MAVPVSYTHLQCLGYRQAADEQKALFLAAFEGFKLGDDDKANGNIVQADNKDHEPGKNRICISCNQNGQQLEETMKPKSRQNNIDQLVMPMVFPLAGHQVMVVLNRDHFLKQDNKQGSAGQGRCHNPQWSVKGLF